MILLRNITEHENVARMLRPGDFVLVAPEGAASPSWHTVVTVGDIEDLVAAQLFNPNSGELYERYFKRYATLTFRTPAIPEGS